MNWITIAIILICLISGVVGCCRGFVRTVTSVVSFVAIVVGTIYFSPIVETALTEHTRLGRYIEASCELSISDKVGCIDANLERNEQIGFISGGTLPAVMKEALIENNNGVIYEMLGAETFQEYIVSYLADLALTIVIFMITLLIVVVIVKVIAAILDIMTQIEPIGFLDRFTGFCLGLARGVVYVWILFVGITLISGTELGKTLITQIYTSSCGMRFYEYNPLLILMLSI